MCSGVLYYIASGQCLLIPAHFHKWKEAEPAMRWHIVQAILHMFFIHEYIRATSQHPAVEVLAGENGGGGGRGVEYMLPSCQLADTTSSISWD